MYGPLYEVMALGWVACITCIASTERSQIVSINPELSSRSSRARLQAVKEGDGCVKMFAFLSGLKGKVRPTSPAKPTGHA